MLTREGIRTLQRCHKGVKLLQHVPVAKGVSEVMNVKK